MFQFTCAMGSMLENADPNRFLRCGSVLNTNIGGSKQELVKKHSRVIRMLVLRSYNVWRMVKDYKLDTNNAHISVETYPLCSRHSFCYDKVVYLDSDLVVNL